MFIGRERELAELNRLYKTNKFQFVVLYGRRRVGKTALIKEFIKDKENIFFSAVESNRKQNLENFSQAVFDYRNSLSEGASFSSFQALLTSVFEESKSKQMVMVVDEYPYVARTDISLASTLQLLIDKYKDESKLYLILCGSSMSYMEDKVLAYKAPLYGRRTAQLKLQPFSFAEVAKYADDMEAYEKAMLYGIAGGTPQYLLQMDCNASIEENIRHTFLNPVSSIYEEPVNLLKQEVREPAIYNAIISAIASGAAKLSDVCNKVGEDTSVCSMYLRSLIALGIVKKETPYGEKPGRKTIYSIEDNMFRFWYRFIPVNSSLISRGAIDIAYRRIEKQMPVYMGSVYEEICRQYLWQRLLRGNMPIEFSSLGRWWGNDPTERKQTEIDIVGFGDDNDALFAECKWTNEKVDDKVLEALVHRSSLFNHNKKYLFIFAKTGFTDGCMDRAKEYGNVEMICYMEILQYLLQHNEEM